MVDFGGKYRQTTLLPEAPLIDQSAEMLVHEEKKAVATANPDYQMFPCPTPAIPTLRHHVACKLKVLHRALGWR